MRRGWGQRGASTVGWAFLRLACRPGRACPPSALALRSVFASRPRRVRSFLQIVVSFLLLCRRKAKLFALKGSLCAHLKKQMSRTFATKLPAEVFVFLKQCASGRALSDLPRFSACLCSPAPPSARFPQLLAFLPPARTCSLAREAVNVRTPCGIQTVTAKINGVSILFNT